MDFYWRFRFLSISFPLWVTFWTWDILHTSCYNVDIENPVIFTNRRPGSYFGASAEIVVDAEKWILVGATKDNFTDLPDIPSPGNVYACRVDFYSEPTCYEIESLRTSEGSANESAEVYEQRDQRLGATILVPEDPTKDIKVCAPNWKNLRFMAEKGYYQVVGNCFLLENRTNLNSSQVSAFRILPDDLEYYAMPLIGFSIADFKTPVFETLYGAPNAGVSSTGGIVGRKDGESSGTGTFKMEVERSDAIKNTYLTNALLGYSTATGTFGTDRQLKFVFVMGAPGFSNKNGNIGAFSVFTYLGSGPRQLKQIEGQQVGGGFGQTICLVDVNGDGFDEILVAAPNWYKNDTAKNRVLHDVGRVYVYYGTGDFSTVITDVPQVLQGTQVSLSRFGTAIANIGDINKDGFNDIAVGAPYENNEGAVYIFNGRQTKLDPAFSQKIVGSQFQDDIRGFGFYISRTAKDLDDNQYNDFAVGAYKSDKVLLLRSRNIITVHCDVTTSPSLIPLNASGISCSNGDNNSNPCVTVSFCFNYTGEGIENTEIDFTITLDTNETRPRVEVVRSEGSQDGGAPDKLTVEEFVIFPNMTHCYNVELRVTTIDRAFFQSMERPIVMEVNYKVSNTSLPGKVRAILNRDITPIFYGEARFDTGCKDENGTCYSNLILDVSFDKALVLIGNDSVVQMKTKMRNLGEPSFNTSFTIYHPEEVLFNSFTLSPTSQQVNCVPVNETAISCMLSDPFYQRMVVDIDFIFEVYRSNFEKASGFVSMPTLEIGVIAATSNDTNLADNTVISNVAIAAYTRVTLQVSTSNEQITASNKSVQFLNTYTLFNEGPCGIETVDVLFQIPVRSNNKVFVKENNLKVVGKNKKDSCKLIFYPGDTLGTTTQQPLPGSSTFRYNTSGINVIPSENQMFERQTLQPIRENSEYSQDIYCDGSGIYQCATVQCSGNLVLPKESDSRDFVISLDILLQDLPELEKGKSYFSYVTQGQVVPSKRSQAALVLMRNVSAEAFVSILLPDSFIQDVEEVDLKIIILGSVGGLLLFLLLGLILWKCGFFKREKRKQVEDFKRKSRYSMRKSRMASVRSQKSGGGGGSVHYPMLADQEKPKKFDEMDDSQFTT